MADWVLQRTGIDPSGEYRGAYTNAREGRRIVQQLGGAEIACDGWLRRAGCVPTDDPQTGDVGLVRVGYRKWRGRMIMVPVGAICVRAGLWAIKPADAPGLLLQKFPLVRAWALPHA